MSKTKTQSEIYLEKANDLKKNARAIWNAMDCGEQDRLEKTVFEEAKEYAEIEGYDVYTRDFKEILVIYSLLEIERRAEQNQKGE